MNNICKIGCCGSILFLSPWCEVCESDRETSPQLGMRPSSSPKRQLRYINKFERFRLLVCMKIEYIKIKGERAPTGDYYKGYMIQNYRQYLDLGIHFFHVPLICFLLNGRLLHDHFLKINHCLFDNLLLLLYSIELISVTNVQEKKRDTSF